MTRPPESDLSCARLGFWLNLSLTVIWGQFIIVTRTLLPWLWWFQVAFSFIFFGTLGAALVTGLEIARNHRAEHTETATTAERIRFRSLIFTGVVTLALSLLGGMALVDMGLGAGYCVALSALFAIVGAGAIVSAFWRFLSKGRTVTQPPQSPQSDTPGPRG